MGSIENTADNMPLVKEEMEENIFYETERERKQMSKTQYEVKA